MVLLVESSFESFDDEESLDEFGGEVEKSRIPKREGYRTSLLCVRTRRPQEVLLSEMEVTALKAMLRSPKRVETPIMLSKWIFELNFSLKTRSVIKSCLLSSNEFRFYLSHPSRFIYYESHPLSHPINSEARHKKKKDPTPILVLLSPTVPKQEAPLSAKRALPDLNFCQYCVLVEKPPP